MLIINRNFRFSNDTEFKFKKKNFQTLQEVKMFHETLMRIKIRSTDLLFISIEQSETKILQLFIKYLYYNLNLLNKHNLNILFQNKYYNK